MEKGAEKGNTLYLWHCIMLLICYIIPEMESLGQIVFSSTHTEVAGLYKCKWIQTIWFVICSKKAKTVWLTLF